MKHAYCWPWRYAYANHHSSKSFHESRWHKNSGGGPRNFGVRRPLRYLTWRLDLDESQTRRMARVLNQLKTEHEQAAVDEKRTVAALAKSMESGTPTLDEAREALSGRVQTAEKLREETAKAIVAISDFLDEDQREEFINLILTGSVSF